MLGFPARPERDRRSPTSSVLLYAATGNLTLADSPSRTTARATSGHAESLAIPKRASRPASRTRRRVPWTRRERRCAPRPRGWFRPLLLRDMACAFRLSVVAAPGGPRCLAAPPVLGGGATCLAGPLKREGGTRRMLEARDPDVQDAILELVISETHESSRAGRTATTDPTDPAQHRHRAARLRALTLG